MVQKKIKNNIILYYVRGENMPVKHGWIVVEVTKKGEQLKNKCLLSKEIALERVKNWSKENKDRKFKVVKAELRW